ncbi:ArsR/SmtB family transcription factor [Paenibacillus sp. CAU 1782]
MVEQMCTEEQLNYIFHALADSTRREMMRLMAQRERTVTELAAPFHMSLAAASKHVKVLEHAGLLMRSVQGRTHYCRLTTGSMSIVSHWIKGYERAKTRGKRNTNREQERGR